MSEPRLSMIVVMGRNRTIGRDGGMPWHLSSDLRHFRRTTMGKPLIMGRRTYESMGGPLPGRHSIVVTRDPAFSPAGVTVVRDLDAALDAGRRIAAETGSEEVIVAGGGTVYAALLDRADRLYVTHADLAPEGDTTFPPIDPATWEATERTPLPRGERDDADAEIVTYVRRPRSP